MAQSIECSHKGRRGWSGVIAIFTQTFSSKINDDRPILINFIVELNPLNVVSHTFTCQLAREHLFLYVQKKGAVTK